MEHGGNYTAALLVAVGCEALSLLLEQGPDDVLVELLTRRGIDRQMAEDIVSALRNGLAHAFDTKFVQVGPKYVELAISWGAEEHLRCETEPAPSLPQRPHDVGGLEARPSCSRGTPQERPRLGRARPKGLGKTLGASGRPEGATSLGGVFRPLRRE